jgi:hypothetical protein
MHGRSFLSVELLGERVLPSVTIVDSVPAAPASYLAAYDHVDHDRSDHPELRLAEQESPGDGVSHIADLLGSVVNLDGTHLRMYWHDHEDGHVELRHAGGGHGPDGDAGRPHQPSPEGYERHELQELLAVAKAAVAAGACAHPAPAVSGADENAHAAASETRPDAPTASGPVAGAAPVDGRSPAGPAQFLVSADAAAHGAPPVDAPPAETPAQTAPAQGQVLRVPDEVIGFAVPLAAALPLRADLAVDLGNIKQGIDDLLARAESLTAADQTGISWKRLASWFLTASAGAAAHALRRSTTPPRHRGTIGPQPETDLPLTDER